MSDNTVRSATAGGDTVRSDEERDEPTGAVTAKAQAVKVLAGVHARDGGLISRTNPVFVEAREDRWSRVGALFERVAPGLIARKRPRRRTGGGGAPDFTPGGLSQVAFDPATLALSGWWRAPFAGVPWTANASAGASLANGDLVTNLSDPATGTAQNGYTPADFDGTSNNLANATDAATLFSTTAGTIVAVFLADTAAATTATIDASTGYDDAAIFVDSNADVGLTFTANGVAGYVISTAYVSRVVACSTGAYHIAMLRWDGSNLGLTLDSAAEVTTPIGTLTSLTGSASIGRGYAGGHFFDGRLLELMTSNVALSSTDFANVKNGYVNTRYALAL